MTSIFARNFYKPVLAVLLVLVMVGTLAVSSFAATTTANKVESLDVYEESICFDVNRRQFTGTYNKTQKRYLLGNESLGLFVMSLEGKNYYAGANGVPLFSDDNVFGNTDEEKARDYDKGIQMFRTLETIRRYVRSTYGQQGDEYLVGLYNDAYDNGNNAFATDDILWSGEVLPAGTIVGIISIGTNEDPADLDMLAHEYMHRVVTNMIDLTYRGESGAIMEAYSDIFAELIEAGLSKEAPDWIHNEERNLKDPSSKGYPSKYRGLNYLSATLRDNGGVHRNSTVLSHAAYLMWNGIDGKKKEMRIDTATLGKLWMRSLEQFGPNVTFQEAASTIYQTARRMGLSRDQVECVALAFKHVQLPVRDRDKAQTAKAPSSGTVG
ncbi:MAG: M4 family metallopeptidase [Clostridia bacterium]|nr:M4 family metallopeptidase [Clostridia bacterium]